MITFVDDDAAYLEWIASHPQGFVLNTERRPRPAYLMLHKATCRTIAGTPERGVAWTVDYIKICGVREELTRHAASLGGDPQPCRLCIDT